jgi:uncharacterized protein YjbI with pentapeptide repeats
MSARLARHVAAVVGTYAAAMARMIAREPRGPLPGDPEPQALDALPDDESEIRDVVVERARLGAKTFRLVDWRYARFAGSSLAGATWKTSHFTDTVFDDCDLANATFDQCGLERVRIDRGRLTGLSVSGCSLTDVVVDGALGDLSEWRFAIVEHALVRDCRLPQSDWSNAALTDVRFEGCDLSGADFSQCRLDTVVFANCGLEGVRGVDGLRGATVDRAALIDLTEPMAVALGITVSD